MASFRMTRALLGATVALVALAVAAGPVLADTERGHTGVVGHHSLYDQPGHPGTICDYDTGKLVTFEVWPPNVWARNKTGGQDAGQVGWRVIVKRQRDASTQRTTLYRSSIVKAIAYDDTPAMFSERFLSPTIPTERSGHKSWYSIQIKMFWYRTSGSVVGTAKHEVDYYVEAMDIYEYDVSACPDTFQF